MGVASSDGGHPGEARDAHGHVGVGVGPVAQLAGVVVPPTLHRAAGEQRTGLVDASRDSGHTGEARDVHGHGGVGVGPVAQLAVAVGPPTLDRAAGDQRTGVVLASSDLGTATGRGATCLRYVLDLPLEVLEQSRLALGVRVELQVEPCLLGADAVI